MARLDGYLTAKELQARNRRFDTGRIYMAEVMDTRTATKAGELKVWILNSGLDRENKENWVTASYCSNFYGTTPYKKSASVNFSNSPKSFGSWFPIPCVGNYVFIFYACMHGENVQPYWFGCPVDSDLDYMIPGIPSAYTSDKGPLCEANYKNKDESYTQRGAELSTKESAQAIYTPLETALKKQGLDKDKLRGYSTAGTKRETPSMCYGWATPMGNTFTIDDGWDENDNRLNWNDDSDKKGDDQLKGNDGLTPFQRENTHRYDAGFRFRTRNGTQLLISDLGNIYAINANGTAWAEITDDGRIQGYAQKSADIACDGDINFKSKRKIIMDADEGFAFRSQNGGMSIELTGDMNISTPNLKTKSIITAEEIKTKSGNIESFESKLAQINGTFKGTLQGTAYYATSAGKHATNQPEPITNMVSLPDLVLEEEKEIDGQFGVSQQGINTAIPTAEPYDGHDKNDDYPKLDVVKKDTKEKKNTEEKQKVTNQVNNCNTKCVNSEPKNTTSECNKTQAKDVPTNGNISDIQLSEHYNLRDVCASSTADAKGINNMPDESIIENLRAVCQNILEPITANYGQKVNVNSGFRCNALNLAVGGSASSQHCAGKAVDIEISGVNNYDLACWIRDNMDYDQLILEFADNLLYDPSSGWVHCSYSNGGNRHQVLTINRSGTRSGLHK